MFLTREAGRMTLDEFFGIGVTIDARLAHVRGRGIKAFARKYDPQPFHIDEEAAKKSVFGGLCASGWHTAATWMKYNLATPGREAGAGPALVRYPNSAPRPASRNLKWLKPVYAGETVTFTPHRARPSADRLPARLAPADACAPRPSIRPATRSSNSKARCW